MAIAIRCMTDSEFEYVRQWSVEQHAKELAEELHISEDEAIKEAKAEVEVMLPDGLNTNHNYLMTIVEEDSEEMAGFIWTLHEEFEGRKQSFICDFAVWESKRRKGYATEALYLTEMQASQAGCQESILFVSDDNTAASALYQKCGYNVLRQKDCGKYMVKKIDKLDSPILFRGDDKCAYRDPAAVYADGWFHLFFTLVETEEDGRVFMYLAKSKSRDLVNWEKPRKLTPRDQKLNYSSPGNVVWFKNRWVICFQTYCRENGEKYGNENSRLFVMETQDLEDFSQPRLLKVKGECAVADMGRMIDPYLLQDVEEPGKWWCFFKQNGVSMSYSYDLENWTFVGNAKAGENVCVIHKDDAYYMFHSPHNGIGILKSDDCIRWSEWGELITLGQKEWPWARGRITAGFVMEVTNICAKEKMWLMFFHGSGPEDEKTMFDQFASIGIAWSSDLKHWNWPGNE